MKVRVCPCGERLKDNQETYCSGKCSGRYRPRKPAGTAARQFNMDATGDKTVKRVGPGFRTYLKGLQPVYEPTET